MRQIKASEVKPGMTIQFDLDGWEVKGTVSRVEPVSFGLEFYSTQGQDMILFEDTPVTVLSEPAPAQPEEPTEFGARVTAGDLRFLRSYGTEWPWVDHWHGELYAWEDVCSYGPVTVIPDQGWTVPDDAPEDTAPLTWARWEDIPVGVPVEHPGLSLTYRKINGGRVEVQRTTGEWKGTAVRYMRELTGWAKAAPPEGTEDDTAGDDEPRTWSHWSGIPVGVEVTTPEKEGKLYRRVKGGMEVQSMGKCWMRVQRANIPKDTTWTEYMQ